MKKSLLLLAAVATLSFVFMGCPKGTDTPDNPSSTNVDAGGEDTPAEIVVFDPATVESVATGEIVDVEGTKYWKVTVDGYNTTLTVPDVNLTGKTTFKCTMYGETANANFNLTVKLADKDNADISSIAMYGLVTTPTEKSAGKAEKQSWNTVSESMICTTVQPMVQDSTANYAAQSGVVVFIGKIIAE